MRIWGPSYRDNLRADSEAKELAKEATAGQTQEEDRAGERAERLTNATQWVAVFIIVAAIAVGGAWVLYGTAAALIAGGVAGLAAIAIAIVVRRRWKKAEVDG